VCVCVCVIPIYPSVVFLNHSPIALSLSHYLRSSLLTTQTSSHLISRNHDHVYRNTHTHIHRHTYIYLLTRTTLHTFTHSHNATSHVLNTYSYIHATLTTKPYVPRPHAHIHSLTVHTHTYTAHTHSLSLPPSLSRLHCTLTHYTLTQLGGGLQINGERLEASVIVMQKGMPTVEKRVRLTVPRFKVLHYRVPKTTPDRPHTQLLVRSCQSGAKVPIPTYVYYYVLPMSTTMSYLCLPLLLLSWCSFLELFDAGSCTGCVFGLLVWFCFFFLCFFFFLSMQKWLGV
jgi:hypothetical protein